MARKKGAKDKVVRKEGRWAQAARLKQTDKQRKAKGLQTISFGVPAHPDLAAARRDQGIASGPEPSLQGSGAQQGGGAAVASDEAAAHEAAANSSPASVIDPADDQQETTNHADNARPQPQPGIDSDFEVLEDDPDGGEDVPGAEAHANSVQGKYLRIVQQRIKSELSRSFPGLEKKWLLEHLQLNGFWLRRKRVSSVLIHGIVPWATVSQLPCFVHGVSFSDCCYRVLFTVGSCGVGCWPL
jgi:hypothetical protein